MPRQSGRRPAPAPARRAAPQQSRSAHTQAAAPPVAAQHQTPAAHPAAPAQSQGPGMFAQMASTAAGVAVGSSIGHTVGAGLSSIFGGGSSAPAEPQQQQQVAPQQFAQDQEASRTCETDARNFTRCLDDNQGNFQICEYYLHQLKACQEAARQF